VGLVRTKYAARYHRNEYKENYRFSDIFKKLPNKNQPDTNGNNRICRGVKRVSDDEEKTKNGAVPAELPPSPVSKNGTVNRRKQQPQFLKRK
jgi:hypothetical protein